MLISQPLFPLILRFCNLNLRTIGNSLVRHGVRFLGQWVKIVGFCGGRQQSSFFVVVAKLLLILGDKGRSKLNKKYRSYTRFWKRTSIIPPFQKWQQRMLHQRCKGYHVRGAKIGARLEWVNQGDDRGMELFASEVLE